MQARMIGLALSLAVGCPAFGQTVSITESIREGDCFRVVATTSLTGTLKVSRDGKSTPLKIAAKNEHDFFERVLETNKGLIQKSARYYQTAHSRATVDGAAVDRTIAADHRLIVAQRPGDSLFCFAPAGPLSRSELEVVSEHFDTLHLTGLLPAKEVRVGDTWKLESSVAQSLCLFDGLISHELKATLKEATASSATVVLEGIAKGIENGAMATLTISATVQLDLTKKRIVAVEWKQKDVRDQGPASPAAEIDSLTTLKRELLAAEPEQLLVGKLATIPTGTDIPVVMKSLLHKDPRGRFQFLHERDWQLVGQTEYHVLMRLLDRGDFVAQATITHWKNAGAGKHLATDEFEKLVESGTGWKQERILERGEVPTDGGRWIYRVSASGELEGSKVVQNFYVVASPNGEQMILTFTMRPNNTDRLGTRDLAIVNAVDFITK
ncbi:MAG: hypothetical protein EXS09_20510 [Gemmataceae bacterium]|nr:hypothetical protein [Gemmataceae bacterium]